MNTPRWLRALAHLNRLPEVWRCARVFRRPAALIACYLRLREPVYPFRLRTRDGRELEVASYHDVVTAWVIFCREEYGMPASMRTILDIGANYGAFSIWASGRARASSVIAVEPFPDCFSRLRCHIDMNGAAGRIAAWNIGLGQHSQDRYISGAGGEEPDCPSQSRAFVGEAAGGPDAVKVSILSLDDLVTKACEAFKCDEIDFVKLDIEGVEYSAMTADALHALKRVRRLSMEYHPNGSKVALFELLASAGLRCTADLPVHENSGVAQFTRDLKSSSDSVATQAKRLSTHV